MIKRLRVHNFMSLRDTSVDLGPFVIFVGPNASGKSALFKALVTLSRLVRAPLRGRDTEFRLGPGSPLDKLIWKGDDNLALTFEAWFEEEQEDGPHYTVEIRKIGAGWSVTREVFRLKDFQFDSASQAFEHGTEFRGTITLKPPGPATLSHLVYRYRRDPVALPSIEPLLRVAKLVGGTWRYRIAAGAISEMVYPSLDMPGEIYVGESGWGLASVLRRIQGEDKKTFDAIEKRLKDWFLHIKSVNFEEDGPGVRLAFATARSSKLVPAELESDGVLHALFLIWCLNRRESDTTVCIEEPENGAHPYHLQTRYRFMRESAMRTQGDGHPQVLVATHSPDLLATVDPKEAQKLIRIVEYDSTNGTKIVGLNELNEVDKLLSVFNGNLGELWWSGAIGGVPRTDLDVQK